MNKIYIKILLLILSTSLISCQSQVEYTKQSITSENNDFQTGSIEVVDDLDSSLIDDLVRDLNQRLITVEIEMHHEYLSKILLRELNFNQSLALQEDLLEDLLKEYFDIWKFDQLKELLYEEKIQMNDYDMEEIMDRTSIKSIYTLMLAYEKVFLEDEF